MHKNYGILIAAMVLILITSAYIGTISNSGGSKSGSSSSRNSKNTVRTNSSAAADDANKKRKHVRFADQEEKEDGIDLSDAIREAIEEVVTNAKAFLKSTFSKWSMQGGITGGAGAGVRVDTENLDDIDAYEASIDIGDDTDVYAHNTASIYEDNYKEGLSMPERVRRFAKRKTQNLSNAISSNVSSKHLGVVRKVLKTYMLQ